MPLQFKDFVGQPCRARTAFEFIPKQKTVLDLKKTAVQLKKGYRLEAETSIILILHCDGFPVSIFKNGKILVRETKDKEEAKQKIESVLAFLKKA